MAQAKAKAANNAQAIHELEAIAPYGARPGDAVLTQRKWLGHFGGAACRRPAVTSRPPHSGFRPNTRTTTFAMPSRDSLPTSRPHYRLFSAPTSRRPARTTPLLLLLGRHDVNVLSEVTAEWFASVKAPLRKTDLVRTLRPSRHQRRTGEAAVHPHNLRTPDRGQGRRCGAMTSTNAVWSASRRCGVASIWGYGNIARY